MPGGAQIARWQVVSPMLTLIGLPRDLAGSQTILTRGWLILAGLADVVFNNTLPTKRRTRSLE